MNLVVFGSTGGIGRLVVEQALAAGHHVTAVARNPAAITLRHECLEVDQGDVQDLQEVQAAITGRDAVISCVGVRGSAPTTVYSAGVANMIQAMQSAQVRRLVCVSASALDPGPFWQRPFAKLVLWRIFKEMYTDLVRMEAVVEHSSLDWTILRPPTLTDGRHTGRYQVGVNKHLNPCISISRADLADYIVGHIGDPEAYRALVEVAY